jgi:hypothetical protein
MPAKARCKDRLSKNKADPAQRALPMMARSKLVKLEADEKEQTDFRRSKTNRNQEKLR